MDGEDFPVVGNILYGHFDTGSPLDHHCRLFTAAVTWEEARYRAMFQGYPGVFDIQNIAFHWSVPLNGICNLIHTYISN